MNIVLAHGFNVRDGGKESLDCLLPYLEYDTKQEADYGYFNLIKVRFCNDNIASVIKGMSLERSVAIGHSNGCAILMRAAEMGASFETMIFINPALDKDVKIPLQVDRVLVYYNPTDHVVTSSKFLRFNHPWGEMGRTGYQGTDVRVDNYNTNKLFKYTGHTGHKENPALLAECINHWMHVWKGEAHANKGK